MGFERIMTAFDRVSKFLKDDDGAATVDFVVMTAAGVAMTVAASASVRETVSGLVDGISVSAGAVNTQTSFGGANGENAGRGQGSGGGQGNDG